MKDDAEQPEVLAYDGQEQPPKRRDSHRRSQYGVAALVMALPLALLQFGMEALVHSSGNGMFVFAILFGVLPMQLFAVVVAIIGLTERNRRRGSAVWALILVIVPWYATYYWSLAHR